VKIAALPANEKDRLAALYRYQILDTGAEQVFDDFTTLASRICQSPIALISFVDETRQWFKAKCGIAANETSREVSFCAHALLQPDDLLIVPNALDDERFAQNPLVTSNPHIRFYAGAPLVTPEGYPLGTICVIDRVSRQLEPEQQDALRVLAKQVINQLELRLALDDLAAINHKMHQYLMEVNQVTRSAAALEKGDFKAEDLNDIARRPDELGQLARVFQHVAQTVMEREAKFQQQLADLKVEIDHAKRAQDVAQITGSGYFQEIQQELANLDLDEFWS